MRRALVSGQLRRAERELAETQRRMHREFCDVHDEFGNFRRRTFAETEALAADATSWMLPLLLRRRRQRRQQPFQYSPKPGE